MSIIAPTSADFLSFNVGESLADLVPMRWTCRRCHMKEAPVRVQNESQVIPAEDMVISLINSQFLGDNLNQATQSIARSLLAAGKSALGRGIKKGKSLGSAFFSASNA